MAIDLFSLIRRSLTRKRQRGFLRDESGVTAVEFGLLALPFFTILAAILETAVVFLAGQLLDTAVQDASRFIRTGQMQSAGYTLTQFRDNVCDRLYGLFRCNGLFVDVQTSGSFSSINIAAPSYAKCDPANVDCRDWGRDPTFQPGQGSAISVVQVYYPWPVMFNFGGLNMANMTGNIRMLGTAAVFRNEPFTGGSGT